MSTSRAVIIFCIVLVLLAGAFVLYTQEDELPTPPDTFAKFSDLNPGETRDAGGYTIERLPDAPSTSRPAPSLGEAPPRPADFDSAAYKQLSENWQVTIEALKKDPQNFNAWMNISSYRGMLGDYKGSAEVLEYMASAFAPAWQVQANLGNMYASYLADIPRAITHYEKAIELLPTNASLYRSLFELHNKNKNTTAAVAVLKTGIEKQPKAVDLSVLLARHYVAEGKTAEAKKYFETALAQAEALNDTTLTEAIRSEYASLK